MSTHALSLRGYLTIFAWLVGLTVATVAFALIDMGAANEVVALTIAVAKGTLVVLYFMHVRYGSRLVWVFAAAGFLWLVILLALTMGDFVSRSWLG